ncbi:ABC transporter C family member 10-like [Aegilops tauschii subsp. strangulata]|nr:ABC transporter C family member 10-like [Triticum aestivum]
MRISQEELYMPVFPPGCYMLFVWPLSHKNKLLTRRDTLIRRQHMHEDSCLLCCEKETCQPISILLLSCGTTYKWRGKKFSMCFSLQCSEFVNFESMTRVWLSNANNAALNAITAGDVAATVGVTQTQETVVSQTELADPGKSACSLMEEAKMVEAPQLSWQRRNEGPHFCWGRSPPWQHAVLLCSDLPLPLAVGFVVSAYACGWFYFDGWSTPLPLPMLKLIFSDGGAADSASQVTPFAKAGFFSKISFWWLNPLMKMGYKKPLQDKDMPLLGTTDRARNQYMMFMEKLNGKKQSPSHDTPSFFWTIVSSHKRAILVSGFFALLKVLTLSTGPIILKAFINVSLGKGTFKHEGYVLAALMFVCKCCESLSQRQWYFRTRRLGLQVRSLLSAAIYKKQQKLSNAAKMKHSSGEIMNYVTVDAYRIGEFPYWFHQSWATSVQLCIALAILYNAVGAAMISSLVVIIITVLCSVPLARLQHKFQSKFMEAQDVRLKAMSKSLVHMKILKLYAWEAHFKKVIEGLREVEYKWLSAFQLRRTYNGCLFWSSPVFVSAATFITCYLLKTPLDASNVFTFVATLRLVQDPVILMPDVIAAVIQAKVAFTRISKFLDAPELNGQVRKKYYSGIDCPIAMNSCSFSWEENTSKPTLKNINLVAKAGEKIAICGEVGSGKSTLLAAVLGEVLRTEGMMQVCGKIAYISQNAWIQTGTVQENILFGSPMDGERYHNTVVRCSLVKDLEMLPYGDCTQIGERGVNLSGGQKQRVQLARALYQNADIYLLDDPFSAVDDHTATSLFNEYVMGALSDKTVLLVTHQVDFLPVFDSILLISDGEVIQSAPYQDLLADCDEFKDLVNAP